MSQLSKKLIFECYQSVNKRNATAEEHLFSEHFEKPGKSQAETCIMPGPYHHIKSFEYVNFEIFWKFPLSFIVDRPLIAEMRRSSKVG